MASVLADNTVAAKGPVRKSRTFPFSGDAPAADLPVRQLRRAFDLLRMSLMLMLAVISVSIIARIVSG